MKPRVKVQGKIIAEYQGMYSWLVMFPSGRVEHARNKSDIERMAKRYFGRRVVKADEIAIGLTEYRGEPEAS